MTVYKPSSRVEELVNAIRGCESESELLFFLRDLLTEPELQEFSGRLMVAKALSEGKSQRVVAKETGISIATVTRVNKWLTRGTGGYKKVIDRNNRAKKGITDQH